MSKRKKQVAVPGPVHLPKNALSLINLGQTFAEYDPTLLKPGVAVATPALNAAKNPERSKCFFIGRRGTGKTAIARLLAHNRRQVIEVFPQLFAVVSSLIDAELLADPKQQHGRSLVACLRRSLQDEVIKHAAEVHLIDLSKMPDQIRRERNLIEDFDFDSRTYELLETCCSAIERGDNREWLKNIRIAKAISKEANGIDELVNRPYTVVLDRVDDSWDGSPGAIALLTALMHACIEIDTTSRFMRPLLFIRENLFDRVRDIDTEFARLATCTISMDWTEEQLVELIERRLQSYLNPKPRLGETWDRLFEKLGESSSIKYVLEYCQLRPRDVIRFTAAAIDAATSRMHQTVTIEDLQSVRRQFSEEALKDLGDEYSENFPQIQVVLSKFHGLGDEITMPALDSFLRKLTCSSDVISVCGSWIYDWVAPHRFCELMYDIGFAGVRTGRGVIYRGMGALAEPAPAVEATSSLVVHPTYRDALDLQNRIVTDLGDDVDLQSEGLMLELPDTLDPAEYREKLDELKLRLDTCPIGHDGAEDYAGIVGDVIRYCFFRVLSNIEEKRRNADNTSEKDWIASIVANNGFWQMVARQFAATQVVWECKNKEKLDADDFRQVRDYTDSIAGRFALLCYRGKRPEKAAHYVTHCVRHFRKSNTCILLLVDQDLQVFIRQARSGKLRENHIRQIFDEAVRAAS